MDSVMEDAGPPRNIGTSREQQSMAREIADSDAESGDEAMVIDDEKPNYRSRVAPRASEKPKESNEIHAPFQLETGESGPLSIHSLTVIHADARKASVELEMDLDDKIDDKSLETSVKEIKTSTNVVDTSIAHAPELPSETDNDHEINAIDILEGAKQAEDSSAAHPQPARTVSSNDSIDETENSRPAVSILNSTVLESSDVPATSTQAEDAVEKITEDLRSIENASHSPMETQLMQNTSLGTAMTSEVTNDVSNRHKSLASPLPKALLIDSFTRDSHDAPKASAEVKDAVLENSQVESAPPSSLPDRPPHWDELDKKSQEHTTPKSPQAELTPEQKRIASLQSRNASLNQTLTSLSAQRTALLHSLSAHLSPYTLADIPSVLKPYKKATYTPSTASHTQPLPAPITPEDDTKLMAEARQVIKDHIGRLHRYNEIRDVGQGLIGIIADQRGKRIVDCMDEFGVQVGD